MMAADSGKTTVASTFAALRPSPQSREQLPVVAVVAAGGAIGALARYGISLAWPAVPGGFPWATWTINVTGCALMGVLMVAITEIWTGHRLVRPFLGTGILGGYTTFSTYTGEIEHLADTGHAGTGMLYLAITPVTALTAAWTAASLTRRLATRQYRPDDPDVPAEVEDDSTVAVEVAP